MSYKAVDTVYVLWCECSDYDGIITDKRFLFIKWKSRSLCSKNTYCTNAHVSYGSEYHGNECRGLIGKHLTIPQYKAEMKNRSSSRR